MSGLGRLQDETFAGASEATATSYPPERRLSSADLDSVLAAHRYAVVASSRPSGRPHATPVSYVMHGDEVWLPTVAGSVRARNVASSPWLVLVLTEGEGDSHLAVILEGPASVEASPPEGVERPEWATEWIVLRPSKVLTFAAPGWS